MPSHMLNVGFEVKVVKIKISDITGIHCVFLLSLTIICIEHWEHKEKYNEHSVFYFP